MEVTGRAGGGRRGRSTTRLRAGAVRGKEEGTVVKTGGEEDCLEERREEVGAVSSSTRTEAAGVFVNGKFCKDPKLATAEDFSFKGLDIAGNTSNKVGSIVTQVNVAQIAGLNTLGVSLARIDYAPYGLNPPHTHPRATEILTVLEGTLYVGFVTSNPENRLFNAVAIAGFGSQNPGVITIANAVFGSKPPISDDVLAKAFQVDKKVVDYLQAQFWIPHRHVLLEGFDHLFELPLFLYGLPELAVHFGLLSPNNWFRVPRWKEYSGAGGGRRGRSTTRLRAGAVRGKEEGTVVKTGGEKDCLEDRREEVGAVSGSTGTEAVGGRRERERILTKRVTEEGERAAQRGGAAGGVAAGEGAAGEGCCVGRINRAAEEGAPEGVAVGEGRGCCRRTEKGGQSTDAGAGRRSKDVGAGRRCKENQRGA
ncbi:hypothetical protein HHK36_006634 [Tetracentron sinense]|uniref:Cupin type-1 domain-containing protein n=1 Tax=Tetracentron sinense TaxID=13715 RepID=A0A834ZLA6_TETSI|nr:hypothetical protein HHK36_006634 [Tetracentron sinense]